MILEIDFHFESKEELKIFVHKYKNMFPRRVGGGNLKTFYPQVRGDKITSLSYFVITMPNRFPARFKHTEQFVIMGYENHLEIFYEPYWLYQDKSNPGNYISDKTLEYLANARSGLKSL